MISSAAEGTQQAKSKCFSETEQHGISQNFKHFTFHTQSTEEEKISIWIGQKHGHT